MTPYHWLAIGAAAIAIVQILAWPWPWTLIKFPSSSGGTLKPADQDVADLQSLKEIQARAVRLNCPEMKAAVTVCFDHFFHGTTGV